MEATLANSSVALPHFFGSANVPGNGAVGLVTRWLAHLGSTSTPALPWLNEDWIMTWSDFKEKLVELAKVEDWFDLTPTDPSADPSVSVARYLLSTGCILSLIHI